VFELHLENQESVLVCFDSAKDTYKCIRAINLAALEVNKLSQDKRNDINASDMMTIKKTSDEQQQQPTGQFNRTPHRTADEKAYRDAHESSLELEKLTTFADSLPPQSSQEVEHNTNNLTDSNSAANTARYVVDHTALSKYDYHVNALLTLFYIFLALLIGLLWLTKTSYTLCMKMFVWLPLRLMVGVDMSRRGKRYAGLK
jgi:hypothetical protein